MTPARRDRAVKNLSLVLEKAEVRLILGWKYRAELAEALPKEPPFFAHAFSALDAVRQPERARSELSAAAKTALQALVDQLAPLRKAALKLSEPGDPLREKLHTSEKLESTRALLPLAEKILAGARESQPKVHAFTDAALARVASALEHARASVASRKEEKLRDAVGRKLASEPQQLALDALLHALDQLAAAALTTLTPTHPKLAEELSSALEHESPSAPESAAPPPAK